MKVGLTRFYQALMVLACLSMLAAFASIMLGIAAREFRWNIQGLDAYAGYSIAATLFLALPATLQQGDHIRVNLVLNRLPAKLKNVLEHLCFLMASGISIYLSWFAMRLVWVSRVTHDVSPSADATPLWIPQLTMALGCIGITVAFLHAWLAHYQGTTFFASSDEAARVE